MKKTRFLSLPVTAGSKGRQHSRWLGLLMMFVLLFAANINIRAAMSFGTYSYIAHQPTWSQPWVVLDLYFYNTKDKDSFFVHKAAEGSTRGPAMYIDGVYIDSFDGELAWPGSDSDTGGTGNNKALDGERSDDDWWKDTHEKTRNGKKYTVRFWNPAYDNSCYHVQVYIWIENLELDKSHTIEIKGYWKTNDSGYSLQSKTWTVNSIAPSFSAPTNAKMIDVNHYSIDGSLNTGYGPTWVGTYANSSNYVAPNSLTLKKEFAKGITSFSGEMFPLERTSLYETITVPMEYVVSDPCTVNSYTRNVYLYKWYNITIPGFPRASNLSVEGDKWSKMVSLSWEREIYDSDNCITDGTWVIFRKNLSNNTVENLGSTNFNTRKFTDDLSSLEYDVPYTYYVCFVPNGWVANSWTDVKGLWSSANLTLARTFEFSNINIEPQENSVQLNWSHETPKNNAQLTFKVWRCRDSGSFYDQNGHLIPESLNAGFGNEPVATLQSSSSSVSMSWVDNNLESNCAAYWYRISTEAMGTTFYSSSIGPATMSGNTEIKNVSANRGTYSNVVKVQWDVKQVGMDNTRFVVYRRLLGSNNDDDYQQVHVVSGTESSYFFEDNTAQPGQFYQYRIVAQNNCVDSETGESTFIFASSGEADGFCQSRGVISGRITYGTGTAVPNVRVLLTKNSESSDDTNQFYSMKVDPQGGILWTPKGNTGKTLFQGKPFTFQMYVQPNAVVSDGSTIIDGGGQFALQLKPATNDQSELYLKVGSATAQTTGLKIDNGKFHNINLTCDGTTNWTVRVVVTDTIAGDVVLSKELTAASAITWSGDNVAFGSDKEFTTNHAFTGYLDDIRLWSKALTDEEILDNYDRLLIGTEQGLKLYWPMDEGVANLPFAYDYSKTSGVANENHGQKQPNSTFSDKVPTVNQLRLYGKTDEQGNYVIRGVPFAGEGTNYMVRPVLGIHEFSPQYKTRFVNTEALTHNGVDFEDVSSFPVSGTIYYSNTDYPVEGVNLYVDGTICAKDGKAVVTNAQGKFTISVPIGDHYITVGKQGHTFELDGRYPDDPEGVGKKFTFDRTVTGLEFYDNTLVTIAGRVVGGDTEGSKPLGMALSENNIGKARVTLSLQQDNPYRLNVVKVIDGTTSSMENNTDPLAVISPTSDVQSTAWRTGGTQSIDVKSIVIETDPKTGEFAALVPPLLYKVTGIEMVNSNAEATFAGVTFSDIDATNPLMEYIDSTDVYQGFYTKEFNYNARLLQGQSTYHCTPTFQVWQDGREDGLFGDNNVDYFNPLTAKDEQVEAINNNAYVFTYPLFEQNRSYKFKLKAYEQYTNSDDENNEVTTIVPLKNAIVTIDNQMSADRRVAAEEGTMDGVEYRPGDVIDDTALAQYVDVADNQLLLDERGEATYTWSAGFPNIYDDLTRTLAINYEYNNQTIPWTGNPFKGIILGALPSGSNFVTAGPDKVTMILRDPAGSGSSASWEKGSSHTTVDNDMVTTASDNTINTVTHFGVELENAAGGIAFYNIQKMETKRDLEVGLEMSYSYEGLHGKTTTTTTTKTISTSDSPNFVGAEGDVFIGTSTNMLFGNARQVLVTKAADGTYQISSEDGLVTSTEFDTEFSYTQHYIENTLIPNLIRLRNDLLQSVDVSTYQSYTNPTDEVKYITLLDENDERFGSNNDDKDIWGSQAVEGIFVAGPSYRAVKPSAATDDKLHQDMVHYYNESIRNWKKQLALNERQKLQAINDRQVYLINNFSFDGGTSVNYSTGTEIQEDSTYTNSWSVHLVAGGKAGLEINKTGVEVTVQTNTGSGMTHIDEEHGTTTENFSFSLVEEGDDALSVDVFNSPDDFAPIFVTRGGQTSCPYEDETVTKYYQPGTSIGAATMKIEDPQLSVVDAKNVLSDVPRGGKAVFYLNLENMSETNSDGQFNLKLVDGTNPNGALLSLSTGPLGNGHTFIVKSGDEQKLTIPLTLQQNNTDIYDYENIGLSLQSDCQSDLESIVYITAHFVPSSSDVTLMADKNVLNTSVGDVLTLSVRDYDAHYENLKAIRLQYKGERDANWSTIPGQEYYVDDQYAASNNQPLPDGGVITVQFPMENYVDGTYLFRAQTATAYGNNEITKESDVVTVIKDMKKPQLFGLASPSDGVLNAGDDISVTFNEDIRQSMLTETGNFKITAALNGQQVAHSVALDGQATECAAKTEANINLVKKDFSTDMWVNYTGAGTLLSHGNGAEKMDVGTDASGHLVVKIGNETYTSGQTITPNKWVFLTLNYQYKGDGGVLNAMFAEDASQTMLFIDQNVVAYEGNGLLAVGKQMTGAIHELTLWDKARSCADAQAEMYYTKKPSTPNLIGYWKFDEGEGLTATDYARNRHMTLAEQTWYVNNENNSVTLNGSQAVKLNISECSALSTEDYAMELWFKSQQTGKAALFSTGSSAQAVEMGFNASGALTLTSNGQTRELTSNNYRDNAWHHLALNVLRSGNSTVYVDGMVVSTIPATAVASLAGSDIVIGASKLEAGSYANYFKGSVDEVRFWKATLTGDYLNRQKSTRLTGEEDGLVAYYPFEHKELDGANQVITTQSAADQCKVYNKTTEKYESTGKEATMTSGTMAFNATDVPRLKEAPTVTNIGFNFVANERTIVIKLIDDADRLEGTTVDFTVKAVLDANGNESDAIHWTAYVKQNQLLWQGDNELAIEQQNGESTTFEATIVNESGLSENWTLSGLPTWLTASATSGTLKAQSTKTITFTVASSTAIGKYEQTIYLTGNNNISEPLTLNLKVKGDEPNWTVNTGGYQFNMNIVGQLKFQNQLSTDEDDIVAAFNEDGDCVGIAHPQYEPSFDTYFTMMTVYGNGSEEITFKAYDASTGKIYPVVECNDLFFEKDKLKGTLTNPFVWNVTDKIEQPIPIKNGWNWISLYVTADDMAPGSVMNDVLDILSIINGPTSTYEFDPSFGWNGTLTTMNNATMYKVNASTEGEAIVTGSPANIASTQISVKNGGMSWIGYPVTFTLSPADAFADLDPQENDMVKNQTVFAVYSKTNAKWIGTLTTLEPGVGYMYSSEATTAKTFTYPSTPPVRPTRMMAMEKPVECYFQTVPAESYPNNMTIIGRVVENNLPVAGIEVAAFVGDECRATMVSDADGWLFLLVPGDSKVKTMSLRAYIRGEEVDLDLPLTYQSDKRLGTLDSPVMIDVTDMTTGISRLGDDADDGEYYDLSGRKLATRPYQPGVYIRNGEKIVIKRK